DWREAPAHGDAFFPGEDELRPDGGRAKPERALLRLINGRLRFVVFKSGAAGGILYHPAEKPFHHWTARANTLVDQTGAGDAFSVGFVLAHLEGLPVAACLQRAVATASFAVESWGPDALLAARRADADARLRQLYSSEVEK